MDFGDLLRLKGFITEGIRDLGERLDWPGRLGAHLKRLRGEPSDPSSLIVYTFDLGLGEGHTAEQFVERVVPVIVATAPTIDEIVVDSRAS